MKMNVVVLLTAAVRPRARALPFFFFVATRVRNKARKKKSHLFCTEYVIFRCIKCSDGAARPCFHGSNDLFRRRRAARSRNANTSSDAVKVVDGCSSWPALTVGISAPSALTLAPAMPPYDVINQYSRYTVSWTTRITLFIILIRKR